MTAESLSICAIMYAPYYKSPSRVSDAVIVSHVLARLFRTSEWKRLSEKYTERFTDNRYKAVLARLLENNFDSLFDVDPSYKFVYARALFGILFRHTDKEAQRTVDMSWDSNIPGNVNILPFKEHQPDSRFGAPWLECLIAQPGGDYWDSIERTGFGSSCGYQNFLKKIRKETKHKFIRGRYESYKKLEADHMKVPEATGLMLEYRLWDKAHDRKDFNSRSRFRVYGTELDGCFKWKQSTLDLLGSDEFMTKLEEALNANTSVVEVVSQMEQEVKSTDVAAGETQ